MNSTKCPHCGTSNRSTAGFCKGCGQPLAQTTHQPPLESAVSESVLPDSDSTNYTEASPPTSSPVTKPLHRGSEPNLATQPLSSDVEIGAPGNNGLTLQPLPSGELLRERRWEVVSVQPGPNLNVYIVRDRQHRYCQACKYAFSNVEESYCDSCGHAFTDIVIDHPHFQMRETLKESMFRAESEIARLHLSHPGLVNLYDAFEDQLFEERPRFYLVSEPAEGVGLQTLPKPQLEEDVLVWGIQLAEALTYLHENEVLHRKILPENILIQGAMQARLTNFNLAERKLPATPKDRFALDVRDLAFSLQSVFNGGALSSATADVFRRVLDPAHPSESITTPQALAQGFREAIEVLCQPGNVTYLVGRLTDVGMVRELNEDSLISVEVERVQQSESFPIGLYAVADGMGGHAAGEVASGIAINALAELVVSKTLQFPTTVESYPELDFKAILQKGCEEANQAVYREARSTRTDLGTTLVAALLVGSTAYIGNIGDSRAYHVTRDDIKQISVDHSMVERLVITGQITPEEARVHPNRNLIYRNLGNKAQVEVDLFEQSFRHGEWLLLCSDGLNGMIEDEQIREAIINGAHPQDACAELIRRAKEAGGDDNITAIVVQIVDIYASQQEDSQ